MGTEKSQPMEQIASADAYAADCIKVLDTTGRLIEMNVEGRAALGIDDFEQVRGTYWPDFWSGSHRSLAMAAVASAREGRAARFTGFFTTLRGEPKWWDVIVTPWPTNDENRGECLLAISRDVTEQRQSRAYFRLLAEVGGVLDGSRSTPDILKDVTEAVVQDACDACFIHVIERGQMQRIAAAISDAGIGITAMDTAIDENIISEAIDSAIHTQSPVLLDSIEDHGLTHGPRITSLMAIPIRLKSTTIGALTMLLIRSGRRYAFNSDDFLLAQEVTRRIASALANVNRFEREAHVAATLQNAMLPQAFPSSDHLTFDAVYAPAGHEALIGGDWYDVFKVDEHCTFFSVGDVTGHGLASAITMAIIRQTIRTAATAERDPAKILRLTEETLRSEASAPQGTVLVGLIDTSVMRLVCASAGHHFPFLVRGGKVSCPFHPGAPPLGTGELWEDPRQTLSLLSGDLLVMVTDGVLERSRNLIEGEHCLTEALRNPTLMGSLRPAQELYAQLCDGDEKDDVAILTICVR